MLKYDFKQMKIIDWDVLLHTNSNSAYLHRLNEEDLLKNFYVEAGMTEPCFSKEVNLEGWEYISCAIKGHFTGHYLSALAMNAKHFGDTRLEAKAKYMVDEMIKCQVANGGEWICAIPEKNLNFLKEGKNYRVPNYVIHKVMMGLYDVYKYLGYEPAKEALIKQADYMVKWSEQLDDETMRKVVNFESGGVLECFAEVYNITKKPEHKRLMERFIRHDLFDRLIDGIDGLTNMHANTTVPEAIAMARIYEITGEEYYYKAAKAYYDWAVDNRGYFVTGGNNSCEVYIPPFRQVGRMGPRTQEHCTSYNMVRLADFFYRQTKEVKYADYMERLIFNSLLAQHSTKTGTTSYFLQILGGGKKSFQSDTKDFSCCAGTGVQSNSSYVERFLYRENNELYLAQFLAFEGIADLNCGDVHMWFGRTNSWKDSTTMIGYKVNEYERPKHDIYTLFYDSDKPVKFTMHIRKPEWVEDIKFTQNEKPIDVKYKDGYYIVNIDDGIKGQFEMTFTRQLKTYKMPDEDLYAFTYGPKVLAGLIPVERELRGNPEKPETFLRSFEENTWGGWRYDYFTKGQYENFKVVPVCDIDDNDTPFTIYFPFEKK